MTTTVINIKHAPEGWESNPNFVYIGRPMSPGNYELAGSIFANPFTLNKDGTKAVCHHSMSLAMMLS